jgi:hypothetical protein
MQEDLVDVLGRTINTRRFLLTVLLTTRYHLTSRPISFANDVFFLKLAKFSDQILAELLCGKWESLSPSEEQGISVLKPISAWATDLGAQKQMSREFGANFREYFRGLNLPWSRLPAVERFDLHDWAEPDHILISVGPNIGIGDEILFFELARRLRRAYPDARLEVVSFHPTAWDLCDVVDHRIYESEDQIAPYARAKLLLERNHRAMVFFVEFASAPIYRQLEMVPGFRRFVYLDTGARLARVIDQTMPSSMDYFSREPNRIYHVLDELLQRVGLAGSPTSAVRSRDRLQPAAKARRVFVNPFSSKDMGHITPEWWSEALNSAACDESLMAEIFCGVNGQTRDYATRIGKSLDRRLCAYELHGESNIPSITETLERVMACDALFGLDTFTAHVRNVCSIPSVTVYLGSFWHLWRVPDANIMNVSADDEPERVGGLLRRLLSTSCGPEFLSLALELKEWTEALQPREGVFDGAELLAGLTECRRLVCLLATLDPELPYIFDEIPLSYFEALESAIAKAAPLTEGSPAMYKLVLEGWRTWEDSNFCRYLRFLATSTNAETTDLFRRRQLVRQRGASSSRAAYTAESGQ